MRRRSYSAATVFILTLLAAACGGGNEQPAAPPDAPTTNPVDPATAGNITGHVTFAGTPPAARPIRMDSDRNCLQQGGTATDQPVQVGNDGGLRNAFVYVKDGLGNLRFPIPSNAVLLDQKGCRYTPTVVGVQVGQPLEVLNSDPTLHNVHAVPASNQEFNTGQPLAGMKHTHRFSAREVMVPFKCDVHPWMRGFVGVLDHPYFAVTSADGSFELKGLPPGTYTIEAWHEALGTKTQTVTIAASETGTTTFEFP